MAVKKRINALESSRLDNSTLTEQSVSSYMEQVFLTDETRPGGGTSGF
jgi:hypothetical protein